MRSACATEIKIKMCYVNGAYNVDSYVQSKAGDSGGSSSQEWRRIEPEQTVVFERNAIGEQYEMKVQSVRPESDTDSRARYGLIRSSLMTLGSTTQCYVAQPYTDSVFEFAVVDCTGVNEEPDCSQIRAPSPNEGTDTGISGGSIQSGGVPAEVRLRFCDSLSPNSAMQAYLTKIGDESGSTQWVQLGAEEPYAYAWTRSQLGQRYVIGAEMLPSNGMVQYVQVDLLPGLTNNCYRATRDRYGFGVRSTFCDGNGVPIC